MKASVLGTGMVGEVIGSKLIELGNSVMMGSRSPGNEKATAFTKKISLSHSFFGRCKNKYRKIF